MHRHREVLGAALPARGDRRRHRLLDAGGGAAQVRAAARRRHALERAAADAAALGEIAAADPLDALQTCVNLASARLASLARLDARDLATLRAEGEALDRLLRVAKSAIDADLAERRRRIAADWGEAIAAPVERALRVLDLAPEEQAEFARVLGREIERMEGAVIGDDELGRWHPPTGG